MKRIYLLLSILILLGALFGCGKQPKTEIVAPVTYYYHNDLEQKDDFSNVFVAETRESVQFQEDLVALLNDYLTGPESEGLINPFPAGLEIISFAESGDTANIQLNDKIGTLSGIDLTMACSCLSLTVFDMTECDYVQISAENVLLSEQSFLTFSRESMVLRDETPLPTEN